MLDIDKYAYMSRLSYVNPVEKMIFSITTLFLCIFLNCVVANVFIFIVMAYMIIAKSGLNAKKFIQLLLIPVSFLLISMAAIAIDIVEPGLITENRDYIFWQFILNKKAFVITYTSIQKAGTLFFTSIASVSCMYFLVLTTHMTEIIAVLRKIKTPEIIIDIMTITYRFIFVLLDTTLNIIFSQTARLGYVGMRNSYRSLASLVSNLFSCTFNKAEKLYIAMESRCGTGCVNVIVEDTNRLCIVNIIKMLLFECSILALSVLTRGNI